MAGANDDGTYGSVSGTSFAVPHVSGLAGLIWSEYPGYTAAQVKNVIFNSISKTDGLKGKVYTGGKINAYKALSSPEPHTVFQPTAAELESASACSGPAGGGGGGSGGGCFIATAAFGSAMEPRVMELRRFRDKVLSRSETGRQFIRLYYRHSPAIAGFISKSELLKAASRDILFPVVIASHLILMPSSQLVLLAFLLSVSIFLPGKRAAFNRPS